MKTARLTGYTHSLVNLTHNNFWHHPRRPRSGQSGREKRRYKSFQVQAEKPLGTDSHRTISKRSSECWLLIGHKKWFVLLCPIGEQHLLSSFRDSYTTAIDSITACLAHAPKKCTKSGIFQFDKNASSETQARIVGERESLNGRKNMARRKVENGEKNPWGQCLTRPVPNGRRRSAFWLGRKTQKFSGTWICCKSWC